MQHQQYIKECDACIYYYLATCTWEQLLRFSFTVNKLHTYYYYVYHCFLHFYHPHLKDGKGTVFRVCVCPHRGGGGTPVPGSFPGPFWGYPIPTFFLGGGGYPSPSFGGWVGGTPSQDRTCYVAGRYASCGHAGGLSSCIIKINHTPKHSFKTTLITLIW